MKHNVLLYLMIAGIVLGILSGWVFGNEMLVVEWIGEMFLDALDSLPQTFCHRDANWRNLFYRRGPGETTRP